MPVGKEVKLYHRDSWQCVCSLEDSHCKVSVCVLSSSTLICAYIIQVINIVTWSPCGSHVTSGDVGGNVTVWKAADQSVAERYVVCINWHVAPSRDTLLVCVLGSRVRGLG